jgi:hypothetical protein
LQERMRKLNVAVPTNPVEGRYSAYTTLSPVACTLGLKSVGGVAPNWE